MMFHIENTIVSLDVIEKEFCCDLERCKGCCCIEGDAGAPITDEEEIRLLELLPNLRPLMRKEAWQVVEKEGISYIDQTGEKVTQIVDGRDCVFARTDSKGWCYCVIEKYFKQVNADRVEWRKPISCWLYPIRLKNYPTFTAVEYHHWDICHDAKKLGSKLHIPIYKFLKEPLVARFGEQWYKELDLVAQEWKKQK